MTRLIWFFLMNDIDTSMFAFPKNFVWLVYFIATKNPTKNVQIDDLALNVRSKRHERKHDFFFSELEVWWSAVFS